MAIKKLFLSLIPIALLVGCASMGMASCDLQYHNPVLVRRNLIPDNQSGLSYPNTITLIDNYTAIDSWVYSDKVTLTSDTDIYLDIGYSWLAVSASGTWNNGDFTLTSVDFAKFNGLFRNNINFAVPYAVSIFSPSTAVYYLYETTEAVTELEKFSIGTQTYEYYNGQIIERCALSATTSGPYYLAPDESAMLSRLEPLMINYFTNQGTPYNNGYTKGYADGERAVTDSAYQEGYNDGYAKAVEDTDTAPMLGLFSAIVGVPIAVLNGLAPLAVWNISIISILITFVFIGLVLWIVRKFFAK